MLTTIKVISTLTADFPMYRFPTIRVHLSTLVLLNFVAGLLLYINLTMKLESQFIIQGAPEYGTITPHCYGWPFKYRVDICKPPHGDEFVMIWDQQPVWLYNLGIGFFILLGVYFSAEYLIKRKSGIGPSMSTIDKEFNDRDKSGTVLTRIITQDEVNKELKNREQFPE